MTTLSGHVPQRLDGEPENMLATVGKSGGISCCSAAVGASDGTSILRLLAPLMAFRAGPPPRCHHGGMLAVKPQAHLL